MLGMVPARGAPDGFVSQRNQISRGTSPKISRCVGSTIIQETNMPVLLVPLLVGIPIVLGGGYLIYHVLH